MKQDKKKGLQTLGNNKTSIVRSSAAEYLTFVAANGEGGVEAVYADENIWLTQKMMATLYDVDVRTVNYHLKKIFSDSELLLPSIAAILHKYSFLYTLESILHDTCIPTHYGLGFVSRSLKSPLA